MTNDYLWDRSGPPDPDIAHLESVLSAYRHNTPHARPRPAPAPIVVKRRTLAPLRAIAAMLLLGLGFYSLYPRMLNSWRVEPLAGAPAISSAAIKGPVDLRQGAWLTTDGRSTAQLEVPTMGRLRIDPDSRLRISKAGGREKKVEMAHGRIHAFITAPKRMFVVDTPSASAIDMGCEYTLEVEPSGATRLDVTLGYVLLESPGRTATVPMGASCQTRPGMGPGTPFFDDATARFKEQLTSFDFESGGEPALNAVLSEARAKDALSLWHLLRSADRELRGTVYDRLSQLKPPPAGVSSSGVLNLDQGMLEMWWDDMRPFF